MKKLGILLLALSFLVACQVEAPQPEAPPADEPDEVTITIEDYYPFLENTYLTYEGIGMEFAERETYFDFIRNRRAQVRNHSTGTTVVQILEYQDGTLKLLFSRGEVYNLSDYTNANFAKEGEILLMEPIEVGTNWQLPDGRRREITGINVAIETPSGNYEALEVTTEGNEETQTKTYYVEGLGMVLSIFQTQEDEVITTLENIQEDTDVTYVLRCYYPDFENEQLVYKDFDIPFQTNDEIRPTYIEHLQRAPNGSILPVFTENITLQSFSYNPEEELVVVDLSDNFVTEMNLGAGYESLAIQSIVNTVGFNFSVEKVVITLDGSLYESGHFQLQEGEYFQVHYENVVPLD
ncbi:Sporulation and spore germination [Natronincola peptidivorans]|uniref:Sporulation and spore germination n=1 Tax=Natronincola peptidivorans TaxID=426128 RepID=A0A1I0DPL3_9FIRM|nr:GerMN domain-containing protein [Natronincola peptidivorans]SET34320.1 Sporulation and spore germination [Natronincola peptidivorans]